MICQGREVLVVDKTSPVYKSTAIYLLRKGKHSMVEVADKFGVEVAELGRWILDEEQINAEVKDQLTIHLTSKYSD